MTYLPFSAVGLAGETFPMSALRKKPAIPEMVLKGWWWRRLVFVQFDEETHTAGRRHFVPELPSYDFSGEWYMWHREDELFAFRYELLRRINYPDLPEWHLLPIWLHEWISGALSPKPARPVRSIFHPVAPDGYASLGNWVWDLTASDEALCKHFVAHINAERRKRGLPDTGSILYGLSGKKYPHTEKRRGARNRPVSWLAVEAYDLQKHQVRPLTDGERSRLSKARREIAAYKGAFAKALENSRRFTPEELRDSKSGNIFSRFVEENFKAILASQLPKG